MFHVLCGRCCPMETAVESLWCRQVSEFWSLVESHGPCALLDLCFYSQNKLNSWPFYMNPTNPPAYKNVCLAIWLTIYTMLSSGLLSPSLSLYKYVSVYLGYLYIYLHIYMDCMYLSTAAKHAGLSLPLVCLYGFQSVIYRSSPQCDVTECFEGLCIATLFRILFCDTHQNQIQWITV